MIWIRKMLLVTMWEEIQCTLQSKYTPAGNHTSADQPGYVKGFIFVLTCPEDGCRGEETAEVLMNTILPVSSPRLKKMEVQMTRQNHFNPIQDFTL